MSDVRHSLLALFSPQVSASLKALSHFFSLFFRLAREQARVRELQSGNQQLEEQRVELVGRRLRRAAYGKQPPSGNITGTWDSLGVTSLSHSRYH